MKLEDLTYADRTRLLWMTKMSATPKLILLCLHSHHMPGEKPGLTLELLAEKTGIKFGEVVNRIVFLGASGIVDTSEDEIPIYSVNWKNLLHATGGL